MNLQAGGHHLQGLHSWGLWAVGQEGVQTRFQVLIRMKLGSFQGHQMQKENNLNFLQGRSLGRGLGQEEEQGLWGSFRMGSTSWKQEQRK